jgi:DNA-directed RNA polymerase subunit RPC12/RpoP
MESFVCASCYRLVSSKELDPDGFWAITLDDPQRPGISVGHPVCPECGRKFESKFREIEDELDAGDQTHR